MALTAGCGAAADDSKEPSSAASKLDDAPSMKAPTDNADATATPAAATPAAATPAVETAPSETGSRPAPDVAPRTTTEARTETRCTGSFVDAACDASSADAGVGGCGHLPCRFDDQASCEAQSGCTWETKSIENEGTDSGKSCHGEPLACGALNVLCPAGCEQHPGASRQERCTGTPTRCDAIEHSIQCKAQRGCSWD